MKIEESHKRPLFNTEIEEAKKVFGNAIDYSKVTVITGKYAKIQGSHDIYTPNGNIYWPSLKASKSMIDNPKMAHNFIHEMAHVLQHQSGTNVLLKGFLAQLVFVVTGYRHGNPYLYEKGQKWKNYSIEQQAEMIADAYSCNYAIPLKQNIDTPLFPKYRHFAHKPTEGITANNPAQWLADQAVLKFGI